MQEGNKSLLYFAYGEHMNVDEMRRAFPMARMVELSRLEGYALCFVGRDGAARPALEAKEGASVPGRVWALPETQAEALDEAASCPYAARREIRLMTVGGMKLPVLVYITVSGQSRGRPSFVDYDIMRDAYEAAGEPAEPLFEAAKKSAP